MNVSALTTTAIPGQFSQGCSARETMDEFIWLFFRLFESRILVVVAEVKNNECWIITGYWEEQR